MATQAKKPQTRGETIEQEPHRQQMTDLCRKIHAVADCAGVEPWDPVKFAKAQYGRSEGEKIAASFVMLVWTQDPDHGKFSGLPPFDLSLAASCCDASIREVIADWLLNPFWP